MNDTAFIEKKKTAFINCGLKGDSIFKIEIEDEINKKPFLEISEHIICGDMIFKITNRSYEHGVVLKIYKDGQLFSPPPPKDLLAEDSDNN